MKETEAHQINYLYDSFADHEVVFNHSVIASTGLIANRITLKCLSESFPCILYVGSMRMAKILILVKVFLFDKLKKANNKVALRLFFFHPESKKEISFF